MRLEVRLLWTAIGLCSLGACFQEHSSPLYAPSRPIFGRTGTISVVISQNIKGSRRFFEHSIDLDTGKDTLIPRPPGFAPGDSPSPEDSAAEVHPAHIVSPNGQWLAILDSPQSMTILDSNGHEVRQKAIALPWSLNGVAWSPDSKSLALLLQHSRIEGLSPRGALALVAGHPLMVADYKVLLLPGSLDETESTEIFVERDAVAGSAAVHWN